MTYVHVTIFPQYYISNTIKEERWIQRHQIWVGSVKFAPKCTDIWYEKVPDLYHWGPTWPTLGHNLIFLLLKSLYVTSLERGDILSPVHLSRDKCKGQRLNREKTTKHLTDFLTIYSLMSTQQNFYPWLSSLAPKWFRLAPNRTNWGLFKIRVSVHFGAGRKNVLR